MQIAKQLKDKNICEYLLYMWQIEDTLRAYGCDADRIASEYVSQFPEEQRKDEAEWLSNLVDMMREEGVTKNGHLQMNKGTLSLLSDRHLELLNDTKESDYSAAYYRALPFIVELRAHQRSTDGEPRPEIETCLEALYGVMMLRLQKKEINKETATALSHISSLLALLARKYKED